MNFSDISGKGRSISAPWKNTPFSLNVFFKETGGDR
jgi:hypothetical protein